MQKLNKLPQDYSKELVQAKKALRTIFKDVPSLSYEVFEEQELGKVETEIRRLNNFSNKTWLLSAVALYSLVYNQNLYKQSGLDWSQYVKQARARLGLEPRDISEQLSGARFFIKYHKELLQAGWTPNQSIRILARAELANELSGSLEDTIEHMANDTWCEFKTWYTTFKLRSANLPNPNTRNIEYSRGKIRIDDVQAVTLSDDLDPTDRRKLEYYLNRIASAMKMGMEPAIIPVYNRDEASSLLKLRDYNRDGTLKITRADKDEK